MQSVVAARLPPPSQPNARLQRLDAFLVRVGEALLRGRNVIQAVQWIVVALYLVLISVPALMPLPARAAHLWNDLTLFAQFVFWGLWWPFVLLSMVLVGRAWCGLLCPEGTLTQFASRHGRGHALPHWIMWKGWPFLAFAMTTIYGQLISVYQYPAPALLILGGSTAAALVVGFLYGRNKRVWCRYLCPHRRLRVADETRAAALPRRSRYLGRFARGENRTPYRQLPAAGAHQNDAGLEPLPHVRRLQRLSRCDCAVAPLA
jgi:hypothetical protein